MALVQAHISPAEGHALDKEFAKYYTPRDQLFALTRSTSRPEPTARPRSAWSLSRANPLRHELILDDLHWADPSSLHLLRHVVEVADRGALMIVLTRRSRPEPHGLTVLGEALARRGALRLDLRGLTERDVGVLSEAATGSPPLPDQAAARRG